MIERHGEFHPFGASIAADGSVQMEAADPGEEVPAGEHVIEQLTGALRDEAQQGEIRAAAICANVEMQTPDRRSDAIQVTIEHSTADPVRVFMPYRKKPLSGCEFADVSATEAVRTIFVG